MTASLVELYRYRELLWRWTLRGISVRYKQSFLGAAWAILQPLAMMVLFTLVFSFLARVPTDEVPYPLFSYVALLPWTFLQSSVSFGVPVLVSNLNLVTKIYFPREILPIGAVGASFFDFLVASTIFLPMLLFYRIQLSWTIVWVPVLVTLQIILTLGVTLLGSAINVLYRDVRFIVPLTLQLWLFATPVIYPVSLVPERLRPYYMLNPMAGIIDSYRRVVLHGQPPVWGYLAVSGATALALFVIGYVTFRRLEASFADII
jgi:lipopolysaccharide transport system permease protein